MPAPSQPARSQAWKTTPQQLTARIDPQRAHADLRVLFRCRCDAVFMRWKEQEMKEEIEEASHEKEVGGAKVKASEADEDDDI